MAVEKRTRLNLEYKSGRRDNHCALRRYIRIVAAPASRARYTQSCLDLHVKLGHVHLSKTLVIERIKADLITTRFPPRV